MVPGARLELAQLESRGILNPLCLPIPPPGRIFMFYGGVSRNRTELHGFAIRCITSLLTRHLLERETRLELATPTLARSCSTN